MNGHDLLTDFRRQRSESAFAELVRRYSGLVHTVARRRLSDEALAREATQTVFIRLAESSAEPPDDAGLVGWLHRTTVHVSIDLWRAECRRHAREHQAAAMRTETPETPAWETLAPVLDEALNDLPATDRQTLLLRFFDGQTMRELGSSLGISEDAAKMRVSRALDRLRQHLKGQGITCSAVALGSLLADRAVEAAPAGLEVLLAEAVLPAVAASGTGTPAAGLWAQLVHLGTAKLVSGSLLALLVAGIVLMATRPSHRPPVADPVAAAVSRPSTARPVLDPTKPADDAPTSDSRPAASSNPLPDALGLLQGVLRARQALESGSLEIQLTSERRFQGHPEAVLQRLSCRFDGEKRWWEQIGTEYRYTATLPDSEAQEARIQRERLDRATAIREGLLQEFTARYVTVLDGTARITYSETDGQPGNTTLHDPRKGSGEYLFDPRCLGLPGFPSSNHTLEDCLGYVDARSIELVGREAIGGTPAWHVRVRSRHDATLDFWIDAATPTRVLDCSDGRNRAVSTFDGAAAGSPIPTEVLLTEPREGAEPTSRRFSVSRARFHHPVEPSTFTLAGLGMPVGTEVVDVRNHRIIGVWNGAEVVDRESRAHAPAPAGDSPTLDGMRSVLELDPTSNSGLEAALWILLHTPDGPDVERAAEVIGREHARHPGLGELCRALEERLRHRCSTNLLQTILRENPDPAIQATACFSLASLFKEAAAFGRNAAATAEAIRLFERVIRDFGSKDPAGAQWAGKAAPELNELRHLTLGQVVPPTHGLDLDGNPLDLAAFRGQVVVLLFWSGNTHPSEIHELYRLQEKYAGRPFAIVGVHCDDDLKRAQLAVEKRIIRWPSFHDTRSGPIARAWNVHGWPTRIAIDPEGRLRYRSGGDRDIESAIEKLFSAPQARESTRAD